LVPPSHRQRHRCRHRLCKTPPEVPAWHPRLSHLPPEPQRPRGRQQPHQGDQANGLRVSRPSLFLPEDQGRLPRKSAMNQIFSGQRRGSSAGRQRSWLSTGTDYWASQKLSHLHQPFLGDRRSPDSPFLQHALLAYLHRCHEY